MVLAYEFGAQPRTNSVQVNGFTNCGYVSGPGLPPGSGQISFTCTFACSGSASYTFDARVASEGFGCGVIDTESITLTLPETQGTVSIANYRNTAGEIRLFGDYTTAANATSAQLHIQQLPTFAENGDLVTAPPIDIPATTPGGHFDIAYTPPTGARHLEIEATLTSCGTLARDITVVECDICRDGSHDPVAWVDGNTRYTDTDPLPPQLNRVALTRTYDTYHRFRSWFGRGWWSFFDARLAVRTSSTGELVTLTTDSNESAVFLKNGSLYTQLSPKASVRGRLTFESSGSRFVYRAAGQRTALLYRGSDGRFAGIRDLATGREMTVSWSATGLPLSVADTWTGITWSITTDAVKRRITSIAIGSLAWGYEYDASDNLQRVAAPGNLTWRTYEHSADRMTTARDGDGREIENHTYDSVTGAATSSTGPGDEIAGIQYDVAGATGDDTITRVTMKTGLVAEYQLRPIAGAFRTVRVNGGCGSCGTNDATYAYDSRGNLILEQDARGFITRSEYDSATGALLYQATHQRPSSCDPEDTATNPNRCRTTPDELNGAIENGLVSTRGTMATHYEYADPNWPDRPTAMFTDSIVGVLRPTGRSVQELTETERRETFTYDVGGEVLDHEVSGWSGGDYVSRLTTTTLYDGVAGAAFSPGGSFDSAWMSLPQPKGLRRAVDGPRTDAGDVTQFVYYPVHSSVPATLRGHAAAVRNALGQITRYEQYDSFGNATLIVDANQAATVMTFDALGRVLTTTVKAIAGCDTAADPLCATDLTSTRTYSGAGPLLREERPSGAVTSYTYDGRGRIATVSRGPSSSDLREQMEYSYDLETGKKSMERNLALEGSAWVEKRRESFAYDDFARLSTVTHAGGATAAYTYDPAGQVASVRDENHSAPNTTYAYDPAGRLERVVQTIAASEVVTSYGHDAHGNLSGVMDPNGNLTSYLYDDFGQMTGQESPVTGTTRYEYDAAGNVLATTDANGARTERTWDALNRVTTSTSTLGSSAETVTWSYDDSTANRFAIGRLSSMSDPAGTTAWHYERRGLLRKETRTFPTAAWSYTTAYQFDLDGNRSLISYPSTQLTVSYSHDYAGRPLTASGVIAAAQYLPFGPLKQLVFANGTTQTFAHDNRYRMTANSLTGPSGAIASYAYHYDAAGNITQIEDELDAGYDRSFAYDELNRLTTASTGSSLWGVDQYSWDAMGNLLKTSRGEVAPGEDDGLARVSPRDVLKTDAQWTVTGRTTEFAYDGTTPRLAAVTTNGIPRSVTYDAAGNETSWFSTRAYSPRNHLLQVTDDAEPDDPLRHVVEYAYDGRGVRVMRSESPASEGSGAARRYFVYSPELRLLSVTRDDGPNVWAMSAGDRDVNYEVVWFGDRPVAQVPTDGPRSYTFADHLGTPLLQTGVLADVTWQAEYEPFGNVYAMRAGTRTAQPLRFPGQEVATSAEGSEQNYNVFRWYRSSFGRFTSADPVNLGMLSGETPPGEYGISFFGQRRLRTTRMMYPQWDHSYGYVAGNPLRAADPKGLFGPDALAGAGGVVCMLDSPLPGPADVIGGVIIVIAGVWAISQTVDHVQANARDRTCRECDDDLEKCKKRCDRIYQGLIGDCARRFANNPRGAARCYAEATEVYADCLRDCEGR